jgi:hypothetical protein
MQSAQAADGFYEELFPAVNRVRQQPGLFCAISTWDAAVVLHRYPFSVVYRNLPSEVQIIAVAHAKRRPGYWRVRI